MKMNVKHLLKSRFAVSQEEIDPLAGDAGAADCGRSSLRDPEQVHANLLRQIGQTGGMGPWNNQGVTGIDRADVHESDADIVLEEYAARSAVFNNGTEDAFSHFFE